MQRAAPYDFFDTLLRKRELSGTAMIKKIIKNMTDRGWSN
jgi:hypothetical protein